MHRMPLALACGIILTKGYQALAEILKLKFFG